MKNKYFLIIGWGRSGSTLLETLMSSCENIVSLGEIAAWRTGTCSCGVTYMDCSHYTIKNILDENYFRQRSLTGKAIVDSSKISARRILHLLIVFWIVRKNNFQLVLLFPFRNPISLANKTLNGHRRNKTLKWIHYIVVLPHILFSYSISLILSVFIKTEFLLDEDMKKSFCLLKRKYDFILRSDPQVVHAVNGNRNRYKYDTHL